MKKINAFLLSAIFANSAYATTEVDELKERVKKLEQGSASALSISGVIEVEYEKPSSDSGEFILATAELGIKSKINEQFSAYITFLYEEGEEDDDIIIDEAALGGNFKNFSFTLGRIYVPFGIYETNLIADPIGLEIGETNDNALVLSTELSGIVASIWSAQNGEKDGINDDSYNGVSLRYESDNFAIGADFISHLPEIGNVNLTNKIAGVAIHAKANFNDFGIIIERIAARDKDVDGNQPEATQVEFSYTAGELTVAAIRQNIDEFKDDDNNIIDNVTSVGFNYGIAEGVSFSAEYSDTKYSNAGVDNTKVSTLKLAYEF